MRPKQAKYLHLQKEFRKWNELNLDNKQNHYAERYRLSKLSRNSKIYLLKDRQQKIIERLKKDNSPIYAVWATTEHSNKFLDDASVFTILEDDFARTVNPNTKVEEWPEEEQHGYLDYLADILEDEVSDYIKMFHNFLEGYTEFVYVGDRLLEIIDKEEMTAEVQLSSGLKATLSPSPKEDDLLSREEAIEYLGISKSTLHRYLHEDSYKEYADILNPIKVGYKQKFFRSNLDAFLNERSRIKK